MTDVLDPSLPIIDAHHHLWDRPTGRYLLDEYAADIGASGHNIVASVHLQCRSSYRRQGPEALRPVGETEFAARIGAQARARALPTQVCAAIVGYADALLGAEIDAVLEAHIEAGEGRFRGIRTVVAWDRDPALALPYDIGPDRTEDPAYRAGVSRLAHYGLTLDLALYHTQLHNVAPLAAAIPNVAIIVNHVGMPARVGAYAHRLDEVFSHWREHIAAIARAPNVYMKLGGLAWPNAGFPFRIETQASAGALAEAWRPFVEECLAQFGAQRCMFESDFPVDKFGTDYRTLWNAFKLLTEGASEPEKAALFCDVAAKLYRIAL